MLESEYSKEQQSCMSLHLDEQSPIVSECEVVGCLGVISPVPGISPTFCTYPEGQSKKWDQYDLIIARKKS